MNAKEQYQLALTIERGRRTVAAITAWTDYDRYLEITSYDDLDDDNYGEIADMVDRDIELQADRNARAKEHHQKLLANYESHIDQRFFEIARQAIAPLDYLHRGSTERFCVFHAFNPISVCINRSDIQTREAITDAIDYRKRHGEFAPWVANFKRQRTHYGINKHAAERIRAELQAVYPHRFQQAAHEA